MNFSEICIDCNDNEENNTSTIIKKIKLCEHNKKKISVKNVTVVNMEN